MKKTALLAVAVALMVVAGAYVILTSDVLNKSVLTPIDNGGGNNTTDGADKGVPVPGNDTVTVPFPEDLATDKAQIALDLSYPGKGQEGTYSYTWNRPYEFQLNSTVLNGFEGRVLTKVFANRSNEIGTHCLIIAPSGGSPISWQLNAKDGTNFISGDLGNWTSSTGGDSVKFTVLFNRTGVFNLTFQSLDLTTGQPLSAPLTAGPLSVPVTGSVLVDALGPGSYRTDANGTHYTVLINITNGWNTRYEVDASDLVLSNSTSERGVNLSAMSFQNQSQAADQSTQLMAYFDITGDISMFRLEYRDQSSGQIIAVPLG